MNKYKCLYNYNSNLWEWRKTWPTTCLTCFKGLSANKYGLNKYTLIYIFIGKYICMYVCLRPINKSNNVKNRIKAKKGPIIIIFNPCL